MGRSLTKCVRQTFSLCEKRRCSGQRKVSLFILFYVILFYFILRFIFPSTEKARRSILLYFNSVCIFSHRYIMSTCVTNPVTLITTTTSPLPVFNLMPLLSLTSWVTRFPGDWRILMIGRLPLASMTSKRTGLAKSGKDKEMLVLLQLSHEIFGDHVALTVFTISRKHMFASRNQHVGK